MSRKYYDNHLGIKGWAIGGRYSIERYLYTLHRLTGLGILFYFILHIFVTSSRVFGPESWKQAMETVSGPFFRFGEFLVYFAFCFHGFNGIRLILLELGFLVGKPIEPIYPYKTSVGKQRPVMIILMIVAAFFIILGGYDFFLGGE
jgi:succinate dehydrogenase / fumarate reductase cytochrome b subunit